MRDALVFQIPDQVNSGTGVIAEDTLKRLRALQRDARAGKRGCHHCCLYESIIARVSGATSATPQFL